MQTKKEGWQSLVECTGLENQQVRNGLVGSNPTPSAKKNEYLRISRFINW